MSSTSPPVSARRAALLLTFAVEGGLGLAAIALGLVIGVPATATIGGSWRDLAIGFAVAIPLFLLFVVGDRWPVGPLKKIKDLLQEFLAPLLEPCTLGDLALISFLAGLGEELFFRGFLQTWLGEHLPGPWPLILASALFGLAHAITVAYVVIAGLIGLLLGWMWEATGSLLGPITAHAVYDFLALAYVMKLRASRPPVASNFLERDPGADPSGHYHTEASS